jgi:hypothetical protein
MKKFTVETKKSNGLNEVHHDVTNVKVITVVEVFNVFNEKDFKPIDRLITLETLTGRLAFYLSICDEITIIRVTDITKIIFES